MARATRWFPVPKIDAACADVSFKWASEQGAVLVVLMHFSRVIDGHKKDLQLTFERPLALKWEEESLGLIAAPSDLPKCFDGNFASWTHPTLVIEESLWAHEYATNKYADGDERSKNLVHYFLVSMNDLVHVLAESAPLAM
jgi:hypothetical protein